MMLLVLIAAVALASLLLTDVLRRYALARRLMDIPNGRSSHSAPTPRGGGVAIVVSFLAALPVLTAMDLVARPVAFALAGGGVVVALIGFLDDHGHIPARWRLLAHVGGALWALVWLGGAPPLALFGTTVDLGSLGFVVAGLYLVWTLNLYNFMDGIDGIASVEAICVCTGSAALFALAGHAALAAAPLVLAAAVSGFLYWNMPPAKVFMGDAGSGFLGFTLGVLSLAAGWANPELLWAWVILLGVFFVDATFTLLRRLIRGERVYEAHRSHAYQYAARRFGCHSTVTLAVGAINLVWLWPMALLVGLKMVDGPLGVLISYAPLVILATRLGAGRLEERIT